MAPEGSPQAQVQDEQRSINLALRGTGMAAVVFFVKFSTDIKIRNINMLKCGSHDIQNILKFMIFVCEKQK